jgi:succinate-semialdehyde dehydrogenase/glutarate-semialdehyde dehydrogenase
MRKSQELPVRNPRTGKVDYAIKPLDRVAIGDLSASLRSAQRDWREVGVEHRCEVIIAWTERLLGSVNAVLDALATDTGRYLVSAVEVQSLRGIVARWCHEAPELLEEAGDKKSVTEGIRLRSQLVPYELVGVISPWNFPFLLSVMDAIPALIAGCAVVVKPSEVTPRFIEPLQASLSEFPELAGVFRWIAGDGKTGAAMIDNVDAVAFTGSVATGRLVAEGCARNFIPCFLELGGKDPAIVLPSADPVKAARIVLRASVQATGQACQSLERVYVDEGNYEKFVDALIAMADEVTLNFPDIHAGQIGPFIFEKQAEIVAEHLRDAQAKGALIRCGGRVESHGGGKWMRPTVVTEVNHSMKIMPEETFGPVIPVMVYGSIDEAVALANDTQFGLSAAVIGADVGEAASVARRVNAGAISINDGALTTEVYDAAHDSFANSGLGLSRMGETGLLRFLRRKAIIVRETEAKGIDSIDEKNAGKA